MAKCRVPGRYILVALLFVGNTILSTHKFDLGIAILAMTNRVTAVHNATNATALISGDDIWLQDDNDTALEQPISSDTATERDIEESKVVGIFTTTMPASPSEGRSSEGTGAPVFSWSPSVQGVILGAYFYGVITPQGLSMPSSVALVARWAPQRERSTFVALLFCGRYMGIVVATLMFGHLSALSVAGGWPFAFYMSGLLGFLWLALWYFLAFDDPACDPKVTALELRKIQAGDGTGPLKASNAKRPMPWRAVVTSVPVWALVVARFTNMWVSMLLFTKLPAYVQGVLGLSLHENANFSSLVFAFTIVSMLGSGVLADCLLRCGLETTLVRKIFQLTANFGPTLCLLCLTVVGTNCWVVLALLVVGKVTLGAFTAGNAAAVVDVAPMYSATLNGMITTFGQSTGVLAPLVAGLISSTAKGDKAVQWARIFYLSAAISFAGGVVFAFFGSAKRQPWADPVSTTGKGPSIPTRDCSSGTAAAAEEGVTEVSVALLGSPALPSSKDTIS
ncbi:vesicular glutamate transporter 3-like isoform X3 [Amblyomma americanum]